MKNEQEVVREAVGVYGSSSHLRETVANLKRAGFDAGSMGLLAGSFSVRQHLQDLYDEVNAETSVAFGPNTAFVAREAAGEVAHAMLGSLAIIGTALAGGAVVASAGILGGALAAAMATTAVFGGVGVVLGGIIHESDAEFLEEQIEEGHLLLFVRTNNEEQEERVTDLLARHSLFAPKVFSIPANTTLHS